MVARTFKDKLTIEDLIKAKIKPEDMGKIGESWELQIKLLEALRKTGPKIDAKIELKEFNKLQEKISKVFLD